MSYSSRPMKGENAPEDLSLLHFPVWLSPKLDGIRGIVRSDGVLVACSGIPIPNVFIQQKFGKKELAGLDGELIIPGTDWKDSFQRTTGVVRSRLNVEGKKAQFWVFDKIQPGCFTQRRQAAEAIGALHDDIRAPVQHLCYTPEEINCWLGHYLAIGMEGVMLRRADGLDYYKAGRSTVKEQFLLKIKPLKDGEAVVIGGTQGTHNLNDPEEDAHGRIKRSRKAEGLIPSGALGTFICRDLLTGVVFEVSSGLTAEQKAEFWEKLSQIVSEGWIVKYQYQGHGTQDRPRSPVFLGFRWAGDM